MNHSSQEFADRIFSSIKQWFLRRMRECTRCSQCDNAVTPWASQCPTCGQMNPARVSTTAASNLALGAVLLTVTLSVLMIAF
jgi:hypothetical protein